MNIDIKILEHGKDLPIPSYATSGSSGVDLYAAIDDDVIANPGDVKLIPCGICLSIPKGYEGQIRSRSGMSLKHGIVVLNSPGTIDADYRGEIKTIIMNVSRIAFNIKRGMKLAQLVITPVVQASFNVVDEIDETARADGGFGSTGV